MFALKPLALAAAFVPAALVAQPSSPLAQVTAHLQAVDTMTANFAQTDRNGQTLTGQLLMKRPGRVRFQYQKGVPLLFSMGAPEVPNPIMTNLSSCGPFLSKSNMCKVLILGRYS